MSDQQQFWNEKFSKEGFMYGEKPNAFIAAEVSRLKKGAKVLCLAEGEGRNACFLAQQGFQVEAIDASDVGLAKLQKKASALSLDIQITHRDLAHWHPTKKYDAIVASFMHLPEPLRTQTLRQSIEALAPEGYIIMEFFSKNQMIKNYSSGGPKNLDLLYSVEELSDIFKPQEVTILQLEEVEAHLDEGWGHQGAASLIRIIAQKR